MIYIQHRQNTIPELSSLSSQYGAEVDLRADVDRAGRIFTAHDPYSAQEDFSLWLKVYAEKKFTGPLVLNTKADLLEEYILEALKKYNIENFLFLDTAIPTFIKYMQSDLAPHFMARISIYEPLEFALQFKGQVQWLWVDCFSATPLNQELVEEAAKYFKLCLVSPELQGGDLQAQISSFLSLAPHCSAICTKNIPLWQQRLQG